MIPLFSQDVLFDGRQLTAEIVEDTDETLYVQLWDVMGDDPILLWADTAPSMRIAEDVVLRIASAPNVFVQ